MKYLLIIFLLFSTPAQAGLYLGLSLANTKLHNPEYKVVKEIEPQASMYLGYSKALKNKLVIGVTTNIIFPTVSKRTIISKGLTLKTKSTIAYVSSLIGKQVSDRLIISGLLSLVNINKNVYYQKSLVSEDSIYGVVYGVNLNYFVIPRMSTSLFYLFCNSRFDLRSSIGASLNYHF